MNGLRRGLLDQIRHSGAPLSPELAAAFGSVPREAFVPDGFLRRDGTWVSPGDPGFLATVYHDDVLVTKVTEGGVPISSSSQPSLMAIMLDALDVRPGHRVLEIGAGTGYNAALLAAMGATVTSVDVQEDVATRARSALARAKIDRIRVVHGDGYRGFEGETFDRVIVTVGVRGLSPYWREQLEPDGLVVAPVEHAGTQPVMAVRGDTATVICAAGFMTAAGPLMADHPDAFPVPAGPLTDFAEHSGPVLAKQLDPVVYRDLWYASGAWNRRTCMAPVEGREGSSLVLLDGPRTGGAVLLPDGSVLAAGPSAAECAEEAVTVLQRWLAANRPPMQVWRVGLGPVGDPSAPIWAPVSWELPA